MQTLKNKGIDMWNSVVDIINSSITPHQVSLAVSIGILGGLWPIPMTSFIGCIILQTILGACFKIDARQMMLIQIVNMIMTPLHLMYYSTFIRFGEGIFKVKAADRFDASSLVENLNKDFFGTLSSSASGLMYGVIGWMCIVPFGMVLFYFFFIPAFNILLREEKDEYGDTKKDK